MQAIVVNTGEILPLIGVGTGDAPPTNRGRPVSEPLIRMTDIPAPQTGFIRILELNKPSTRNAISRALLAELRSQIDGIHSQYDLVTGQEMPCTIHEHESGSGKGPTRALIIATALDSCFSAGADLKERKNFTIEETTEFLNSLRSTFTELSRLPIPTISAIASLALGGGLELALATHFRVMSSIAAVALPETRLGIIPGAGGTYRLSALIGVSQARRMILTGRRVEGREAYRLGIADCLVEVGLNDTSDDPDGGGEQTAEVKMYLAKKSRQQVLSEAVRLAKDICQGGPVAVRAAIQALQPGLDENTEGAMYERVMATEDRMEALRAFEEKRSPVFHGR